MKTLTPIVDEKGDINVHGRQGAIIRVKFTNDDGTPRDMTGKTVTFECGTGVNINLTAGASSDERVLTLAQADVKTIFASGNRQFIVMDASATVPTPLWIGTVYVTGWVE